MVSAGDEIEHQENARDHLHDENEQQTRAEDIGPARAALDRLVHYFPLQRLQIDPLVDEVAHFLEESVHLGNADLLFPPRLVFDIDNLDVPGRRDLDRKHIEWARRRPVPYRPGDIGNAEVARAQKDLAPRLVRTPLVAASEVGTLAGEGDVWDGLFVDPDDLAFFIIKMDVAMRVDFLERFGGCFDHPMILVLFPLEHRILEGLLEDVLHADIFRHARADVAELDPLVVIRHLHPLHVVPEAEPDEEDGNQRRDG